MLAKPPRGNTPPLSGPRTKNTRSHWLFEKIRVNFRVLPCDRSQVRDPIFGWRGWGQHNFSLFRVRRFTESPGPLHWIAFPVEILTKPLIHWIASTLFTEKNFFSHRKVLRRIPLNQKSALIYKTRYPPVKRDRELPAVPISEPFVTQVQVPIFAVEQALRRTFQQSKYTVQPRTWVEGCGKRWGQKRGFEHARLSTRKTPEKKNLPIPRRPKIRQTRESSRVILIL